MRNAVVHGAAHAPPMFVGEDGVRIPSAQLPFAKFMNWRPDDVTGNDLVPLFPAVAMMVFRTVAAVEDIIVTLTQLIDFGPPICPGHSVFIRARSSEALSGPLMDAKGRLAEYSEALKRA